jgi:Tfp pilus assembly protein PilX
MVAEPGKIGTHQQGLALLVALIALVAMSLVAILLARTVMAQQDMASNLAFREVAMGEADIASERARDWLLAVWSQDADLLKNDQTRAGYYATSPSGGEACSGIDFLEGCPVGNAQRVAWQDRDVHAHQGKVAPFCQTVGEVASTGDVACYVIERLCEYEAGKTEPFCQTRISEGFDDGSQCAEGRDCSGKTSFKPPVAGDGVLYRITVRVSGPRENAAYTQTYVLL